MANLDKIPKCEECGQSAKALDSDQHVVFYGKPYCLDCALKLGMLGPLDWLYSHGICIYHHAEFHDGKIIAYQKWGRGYRKDELEVFR